MANFNLDDTWSLACAQANQTGKRGVLYFSWNDKIYRTLFQNTGWSKPRLASFDEEKLLRNMDIAFSVLGDGWQMDEVMENMFDECIQAAEKYANSKSGLSESIQWALNSGDGTYRP